MFFHNILEGNLFSIKSKQPQEKTGSVAVQIYEKK